MPTEPTTTHPADVVTCEDCKRQVFDVFAQTDNDGETWWCPECY